MNKKDFYAKLKNREFEECINILRKEIIDILVLKIKEKDAYFTYSTTRDLYNKSKKYLDEKYSKIAYKLYSLDVMEELDEYVLEELFESCEIIKKK